MEVKNRIEQQPPAVCPYINLDEKEKALYMGSGYCIAWFINGELMELFNPLGLVCEPDEESINEALKLLIEHIASLKEGEIWLVMCSGYQLCDPQKLNMNDAGHIARVMRVFAEEIIKAEGL